MRHALLSVLVLALVGCSTTPKFRALKGSSFTYPTEQPIKLFIAEERDRSGGQYRKEVEKYDLDGVYIDDAVTSRNAKGRLKVHADRMDPLARLGASEYMFRGELATLKRPA